MSGLVTKCCGRTSTELRVHGHAPNCLSFGEPVRNVNPGVDRAPATGGYSVGTYQARIVQLEDEREELIEALRQIVARNERPPSYGMASEMQGIARAALAKHGVK